MSLQQRARFRFLGSRSRRKYDRVTHPTNSIRSLRQTGPVAQQVRLRLPWILGSDLVRSNPCTSQPRTPSTMSHPRRWCAPPRTCTRRCGCFQEWTTYLLDRRRTSPIPPRWQSTSQPHTGDTRRRARIGADGAREIRERPSRTRRAAALDIAGAARDANAGVPRGAGGCRAVVERPCGASAAGEAGAL